MLSINTRHTISKQPHRIVLVMMIMIGRIMGTGSLLTVDMWGIIAICVVVFAKLDYRWIASAGMGVILMIMVLSVLDQNSAVQTRAVLLYYLLSVSVIGSLYEGSILERKLDMIIDKYRYSVCMSVVRLVTGVSGYVSSVCVSIQSRGSQLTARTEAGGWMQRLLVTIVRYLHRWYVYAMIAIRINISYLHVRLGDRGVILGDKLDTSVYDGLGSLVIIIAIMWIYKLFTVK